jgi:hypothetical protein
VYGEFVALNKLMNKDNVVRMIHVLYIIPPFFLGFGVPSSAEMLPDEGYSFSQSHQKRMRVKMVAVWKSVSVSFIVRRNRISINVSSFETAQP